MKTTECPASHRIVSREEWTTARQKFLAKEKEFTRLRDQLSRERRELPWVKVDRAYTFESTDGKRSLADLFEGRGQLVVYHFMFGPGWEEGCRGCSYVADHFDGCLPHLHARDVSLAVVSRAPLAELLPFKRRMGWKFPWVSSAGNDFNRDHHVSWTADELAEGKVYYNYAFRETPMEEMPGLSVFARGADGAIYHTYSTYSRGLDILLGTYNLIDLTPKGRDEAGFEMPMEWLRYHDRYETASAK
ncbi:MAG TPA: thioredoxin family protein [Rariglobus sp.]|jgi:predicted dithiol-disulfide oxidoreductase (DUF899 family)|nr:thioredoxin family protein [Rariglobus sp.]